MVLLISGSGIRSFAARLIELIDNMAPTDKYKGQSADHGEGKGGRIW